MRGAAFFASFIALVSVACVSGKSSEATSMTTVTSADARSARSDRAMSDRIATALCVHEVECGRGDPIGCIDAAESRTSRELAAWSCEPAKATAAADRCLAALRNDSCSTDLGRAAVCPPEITKDPCAMAQPAELRPE